MRCFLLATISLLSFNKSYGLSGTYTIDPSGSGATNYTTWAAAISALNSGGHTGDIIFNVAAGTFSHGSTAMQINAFSGSGTYSVVFQGAGKTSTTVTSTASTGTIYSVGGDKITFRDMTIANTSTSSTARAFSFASNASNDWSIRNCNITASGTSGSTSCIYSTGLGHLNMTIDSCSLSGGFYGLFMGGGSSTTTRVVNFTFSNSSIAGYNQYGFYLYYTYNAQVINNNFVGGTSASSYSSWLGFMDGNGAGKARFNRNRFTSNKFLAIYFAGSSNGVSTSNRNEMHNNVVQGDFSYSSAYVCYMTGSSNWEVYHNTFATNITANSSVNCLYSTGSGNDFRNNTLISSGGYHCYITNSGATVDYNNYYSWAGSGTPYSVAGTGSNSVSINQGWSSLSNLDIVDGCANGVNLGVSTDINGKTRSNPPDIGAFEATTASNDAGITAIISPASSITTATQNVTVKIKNFGSTSLGSVDLNYQVGSGSVVTDNLTFPVSIVSCRDTTVTHATGFSISSGCTNFKVWTSSPNSNTDGVASNDTLQKTVGVGTSGTFTVGGSGADFANLNAAFSSLQCTGISGPTTLLLGSTTLTQQVYIPAIPGTSSANRLTIKGNGKSNTKISFSQSSSTLDRATLIFDGCDYVEVRDLTVEAANQTYGWAVNFRKSSNCAIRNCNISAYSIASTTSNIIPVVIGGSNGTSYSIGGQTFNTTIDSCVVDGGGYANITSFGVQATPMMGLTISNTTLTNSYSYGAFMFYSDGIVLENNFLDLTRNTSSSYAVYLYNFNSPQTMGHRFVNNRLNSSGGGIYMGYVNNPGTNHGKIINNAIICKGNLHGIYMFGSSSSYISRNWQIYHNSIDLQSSSSNTRYALYSSSMDTVDIRNNILSVHGGSASSYALFRNTAPNGTSDLLDYNVYYNAVGSSLIYSGSNISASSLNSYSTNGDVNSVNALTSYVGTSDLHLSDACYHRGTNVGVTTDIDGQSRTTNPHIGCDEVPVQSLDAGVLNILSPSGTVTSGTQTVQVIVKNFGTTGISSVKCAYQVGTATPVTQTFTPSSSIANCQVDTFTFTNTFSHTSGCSQLKSWTSEPNSSTDGTPGNDSATSQFGIPMSGTYTIGGSSPDFTNFQGALNGLNCAGISGPVIFNVRSGTYSGQIEFSSIGGMSSTNTVAFQSDSSNTAMPVMEYQATGLNDNYVVRFKNAQYFIFDGIHLKSKDVTYGCVVEFINANSYITIKNGKLESPTAATSSTYMALVYDNTGTANMAEYIVFDNNDFINGSYAVYTYGGSTSTLQNGWEITNNRIKDFAYYGIFGYFTNGIKINGNDITTANGTTSYPYGMSLFYADGPKEVIGNNIHDMAGGYGMQFYYNDATSSSPSIIANNFIQIGSGANSGYGMMSYYSSHQHYYHNSLNMTGQYGYGLYLFYSSSIHTGNVTKNNIIHTNDYYTYLIYAYSPTASNITSDYNCLSQGASGGYFVYAGSTYSSLSAYQSGTGRDANSITTDPKYYAYNDLHCISGALDSAGTYISSVTTDIDGETRRTSNPSIGADEFTAVDDDAGISAIVGPLTLCSSNSATVTVRNSGEQAITSVSIHWKVNGTAQSTYSFTGSLASGASTNINLGTFSSSGTSALIEAWTSSPNGKTDQKPSNDSTSKTIYQGMSGTFTVGGSSPDFPNLTSAISELELKGICGNIILNVRPGTYDEQVVINNIKGTGPNAWLTVRRDPSSSGLATFQYAITSSVNNYVIKLNGASYVNLEQLHLKNSGTSTFYTTLLSTSGTPQGTVHDINVKYCFLEGLLTTTTSTLSSLMYFYASSSAHAITDFNIENNTLYGGGYGIYNYGYSPTPHKNVTISNNWISDYYYMGVYNYFSDTLVVTGNQLSDRGVYSTTYGMYNYYCQGGINISRNKITCNATSSNYGLFVYYAFTGSAANVIANNMVSLVNGSATGTHRALTLYDCQSVKLYHNTFHTEGGPSLSTGGLAGYIYMSSTSYGPYDVRNNIFSAAGTGRIGLYYDGSAISSTGMLTSDYNNYSAAYLVGTGGTVYNPLSTFTTATGWDGNSKSLNPMYDSTRDLHINNIALHESGAALGVSTDYDGDTRSTIPTIGAHEIDPDITMAMVSSDTVCGTSNSNAEVNVTFYNYGDISQFSIPVVMIVDGGTPQLDTITGTFGKDNSFTRTLNVRADLSGTSDHNIVVYANGIDVDRSNDTASTNVPYWPYPVSSFTNSDSCFGAAMKFTNTSMVSSGSIASTNWTFGDGNTSTSTNPSNSYSTNGTYTLTISSTSNNGCSDTTSRTVNVLTDINPGSIGSNQTICYGFAPATFTSGSGASGSAGNYLYQWQMSSDNTNWSDISGATTAEHTHGDLTANTWFRRAATTDIGCGPKYTASVKVTVYDQLMGGTIGSNKTICYNTIPTSISQSVAPTGGNGSWTYQWQRSIDNATWSDISGATNTTYQPVSLKVTTYYRLVATGGMSCGSVESNTVTITVYNDLTAGVIGSDHSICPNGTPALINGVVAPSGGDGNYTYQWQSSPFGSTWTNITGATSATYQETASLTSGIRYRRQVTSGSGCGMRTSNSVVITIAPLPQAKFILANHCFNDVMPVTNNSTVASGSITGYSWNLGDGNSSTQKTPSHVYATSGSKTVKLVVTSDIGCKDSSTSTVNVSNVPSPSFRTVFDCKADSMNFKNTTSVNCGKISAFFWDFGDGSSSTKQNPTHKYASSGTYSVKFKIFLPGGFSDSVTQNVTLHKDAVSNFTVADMCFGDSAIFVNKTVNASSYSWTFGDNNTSTSTNPVHFYRVTGTYSVRLIATDGNLCNDTTTKSVIVKVRPSAYFATDDRCVNTSLPFDNGTYYAHTYVWDFGDGNTSTSTSTKVPHAYAAAGTYNVTLYANNNNGCKDTAYETVVVFPNPKPSFTHSGSCKDMAVSFTNNSTGQKLNNWTFGNGAYSTDENPTNTYSAAGTYTVKLVLSSANNCTDSTSQAVTIYDNPSAGFSVTDVCVGSATSFTNTSSGGSGTLSYAWNFGDGNTSSAASPTHSYAAAGKYNVTLTTTGLGSCNNTITKQVEVFEMPTVSINSGSACLGSAINFSANTTNANSYAWNFGNGVTSTSNAPSYTYPAAGTYTVSLTVSSNNGCQASATATASANPIPVANFSAANGCQGVATSFTNASTIASGSMTYAWSFGDGNTSTLTSPSHTYAAAGSYTITLVATSAAGCSNTISKSVTVFGKPVADFTASNVCVGNATSFANYSAGAATYSWAFGDGSTASVKNTSHTYSAAGTYVAVLTVTSANGCTDQKSASVVVYAKPAADFSVANGCVNTSISFTNNSATGSYLWDFGNGYASTATSPSHTYTSAGTYTATLKVTNSFGCENSVAKSVTIHAQPVAAFTNADGCVQKSVAFTNTSSGATTYGWTFGDAGTSSAANPTHAYSNAGSYTVTLTATNANNCSNKVSRSITIHANPSVAFTASDACNGNMVNFSNTSSDGVNNWNFGNGATSAAKNPSHLYATNGAYNVSLTVTSANGCSGSANRTVNVFPNPVAAFTATALCTGPSANFNNTSSISSGSISSVWNYGDGNTGSANSHTYGSAGNYNVMLTVTSNNSCKATATQNVAVFNAPVASFTAPNVCDGKSVNFVNTSGNITTSSWDFGDSRTSTNNSPSHKYSASGTYNVTLTASNAIGCTSVVSNNVNVMANPVASFTASNGCAGSAIAFTNNSGAVANSLWDFGDGGSSGLMNPTHVYSGSGTKTIALKVTAANKCTDIATKTIDIFARPLASFSVNNTCDGDLTQFVNTSQNGNNFNWNFGDGNTSTNTSPTNKYAATGSYNARLVVNNANCSDTLIKNIAINALPNSGFSFSKSGRLVNFTPNATAQAAYDWNFDDGSTSTEESPAHNFSKAVVQTFNVCLRVTDLNGCQSQSCDDLTVDLLGTSDIDQNSFAIYPNPNTGNFTVQVGQVEGSIDIEITDATGKLIHIVDTQAAVNQYNISLSNLATGVYLVHVKNGQHTATQRIMITK